MPEGSVAKFAIGAPIELAADAYPGQVFKGEVEAFDARLSQDTRTLMVRGKIPNPDRKLLPGAPEPTAKPAPTVSTEPVASAAAADADPVGAVPAAPKLTVERRFVRVGPTEGDRVAILEGVKAGEQVVTSGQLKLQPGATIKVDNSGALKPPAELPKQ